MDTALLQAFTAVAQSQSFSHAADSLHLTQPAISKRIQTLEQQLGVALFDRVGRRISLTEAGRALLPRAQQWLHDLDDMRRVVSDFTEQATGQLTGMLTVGTSHHIGLHRLPPALRTFSHLHPHVHLDIRFIDSEQAYDAVLSGELELGIVTLPPVPDERLVSQVIWQDPLSFVAAHNHPLQATSSKRALQAKDLAEYAAILPSPNTFTRQLTERMFEKQGLVLQASMETNYLETIKMMVSIGLGWSVLPSNLCDDDVLELPVRAMRITRQLGVVYHPRRVLSRAASSMLQLLIAESAQPTST